MALSRTGVDRFDGILRQADKQTSRQTTNRQTNKRRADKQTSDRTEKRQAGENGSGGYRTENRVAMGGKENFVDKSLLFDLNLLSLYYTMEHRIHH